MSNQAGHDDGSYWRVDFIQATPQDARCVMLYGEQGEIVGPLTMELAEAWLCRFDIRRAESNSHSDRDPASPTSGRRFDQVGQNLKVNRVFKEIHS